MVVRIGMGINQVYSASLTIQFFEGAFYPAQHALIKQGDDSLCPFLIILIVFAKLIRHKFFLYFDSVEIPQRDRDHH